MRIAHINTTADGIAAPSRIMLSIARGARPDDETMIYYGRGNSPDGVESKRIGSDITVGSHYLFSRINDSEGLGSMAATRKMIRHLKEWCPDIVHLHNLHGHYLHLPLLLDALKSLNIPVIATLHDCWLLTGHCAFYSHTSCSPARCTSGSCPLKHEYPSTLFAAPSRNLFIKHSHLAGFQRLHFVAPSQWMAHEAQQWLDYLQPSITVIPHGINHLSFTQHSGRHCGDDTILAIAARWESRKGLDAVLTLGQAIVPRPLLIAGRLPRHISLPSNVRTIGPISAPSALADFYRNGAVLINAGRAETFGLTTVEALSCGTPVVVDNACATAEVLAHPGGERVGIATDTSSIPMLLTAVDRASRLSSNDCQTYAVTHFSDDIMVQRYYSLYQQLI